MDGEGLFGDAGVEPDLEFGPQERAPEPDDRPPEPDLQFGAQDFLGAIDGAVEQALARETESDNVQFPPHPAPVPPPPQVAPVEPAEAEVAQRVGSGVRVPRDAVHWLSNGAKITYYRQGFLECICPNPANGKCSLTRTTQPPTGWRTLHHPQQGRPLGRMLAWAAAAYGDARGAKEEHKMYTPAFVDRRDARASFKAAGADVPDIRHMFEAERPKYDDEGSEPEMPP